MGGYGSGRRWAFNKKNTVEDGLILSVFKLYRDGLFIPSRGILTWSNSRTGEKVGAIGYLVQDTGPGQKRMTLDYVRTRNERKETIEEPIEITSTRPNFGGSRYWLICPLVINGETCNRRTGKLYLPPGARYFGCRHCFDLTYTSAQTHNKKWDGLNRLMKSNGSLGLDEAVEQLLPRKKIKAAQSKTGQFL